MLSIPIKLVLGHLKRIYHFQRTISIISFIFQTFLTLLYTIVEFFTGEHVQLYDKIFKGNPDLCINILKLQICNNTL